MFKSMEIPDAKLESYQLDMLTAIARKRAENLPEFKEDDIAPPALMFYPVQFHIVGVNFFKS
jgi:hypothetical protein